MAIDAFMKIEGPVIEGESQKKGFEKQIEIDSFGIAAHQTATMHSGSSGGGAGKGHLQDIMFSKRVDKCSPTLLQNCLIGTHYDKITMTLRKVTGGVQLPFLIYTMEQAIFSSYSTSGSQHSEELLENMSINFARFTMEYNVQDAKGAGAGKNTASWDMTTGEKVA